MFGFSMASLFWSTLRIVNFCRFPNPSGKDSNTFWDKWRSVRLARPPISSGRSSNLFSEISRQASFFRLPISCNMLRSSNLQTTPIPSADKFLYFISCTTLQKTAGDVVGHHNSSLPSAQIKHCSSLYCGQPLVLNDAYTVSQTAGLNFLTQHVQQPIRAILLQTCWFISILVSICTRILL